MKIIGEKAFYNCSNLTDVYYIGSEEEWGAIKIGNYSVSPFASATKHYNHVIEE